MFPVYYNNIAIILIVIISSCLGDLLQFYNILEFNKNVLVNGSALFKKDFMEIIHGLIYQSPHVDILVIKVYVLEFVFNKSYIFKQGKDSKSVVKFMYRFQVEL